MIRLAARWYFGCDFDRNTDSLCVDTIDEEYPGGGAAGLRAEKKYMV